ncbi:beta strand repeat-containing protein, partial [Sessilibacter sp. MAH4]
TTDSGVLVTNAETINNTGTLTGSSGLDEAFALTADQQVAVSDQTFNAVGSVQGNGGDADSIALSNLGVNLSGGVITSGTTSISTISTVTGVDTLVSDSGVTESFDLNGTTLAVNTQAGVSFEDVNTINGDVSDSIALNNNNATLTSATAFDTDSGVRVNTIGNVSGTGQLTGNASVTGGNSFTETGSNQVSLLGFAFSGVNTVDGDTAGMVNVNNSGVALGASDFTSGNSITYTNVTTATQVGTLTGTTGDDSFDEIADNQIDTNGFAFQGVSTVNGNGGTDSLAVRAGSSASLNAADFTVSGITYTNIDAVDGVISVSDSVNGNRSYTLTNNDLDILGSTFNNITTLTAGTGT